MNPKKTQTTLTSIILRSTLALSIGIASGCGRAEPSREDRSFTKTYSDYTIEIEAGAGPDMYRRRHMTISRSPYDTTSPQIGSNTPGRGSADTILQVRDDPETGRFEHVLWRANNQTLPDDEARKLLNRQTLEDMYQSVVEYAKEVAECAKYHPAIP